MGHSQQQHSPALRQHSGLNFARLDVLVKQTPAAIGGSLGLSLLITPALWAELPQHLLITWLIAISLIGLARISVVRYIKYQLKNSIDVVADETLLFYERACGIGGFCTGLTFGCLDLFLTPGLSLATQFIIPFTLAGLTAGAIASSVSSLLNYYAFTIPALILLVYGLYTAALVVPAILVGVYFVLMLILSRRVISVFVDGLSLKEHNADLVANLTDHNKALEQLLAKLDQSEKLSSGAFNKVAVTMMLIDKDLEIFKVNDEACLLLGYNERQLTSLGLLNLLYPNDKEQSQRLFMDLISGKRPLYQSRKRYVRVDKIDIWVQETVSAVTNDDGEFEYAIVHAQDVTQEYRLTQKLSYQANHDVVTGLLNRYAFETKMQHLFLSKNDIAGQIIRQHVLCYIDLDQFKVVNDTFGHSAGDDLLRELGKIFKQNLRKSDLLARIGGDEFAVLMFDCSTEAAKVQLEQLLDQIRNFTFKYEQHLINTTASIGLVAFDHTNSMSEILKQADSACYGAKEGGRDRLHAYSQDDVYISRREEEMPWVSRIQQALTDQKFVLYYQEIVQIAGTDTLPHYELLIRMKADDGKIIPPGLFLPAAENYNLAASIDLWVVDHVLATLCEAKEAGKGISGIYGINLSGHSLGDKRFYEQIISRVNQHAHLAESEAYICFEITETAAISNMSSAMNFINELRSMGCLFALDDFGSGLSSYAYLQQMPIDFLKIDGMFVKDCLNDVVKLEMIRSINSVGHVMGLKTIAEFVENEQIFDKLGEINVDYAQGYWNGPPKPWVIEDTPLNDIRPIASLSA